MTNIAIFNVCYSSNLGDGILACSLAAQLEEADATIATNSVDLAGRQAYGDGATQRTTALRLLGLLPRWARRFAMWLILGSQVNRKLRPKWRKVVGDADVVVIGGGNLLSDVDLNFPLKIGGLMKEVQRARKPYCVYGVGVSSHWSFFGRSLFRRAFKPTPLYSAVRDEKSAALWAEYLGTETRVCCDPAVLASRSFRRAEPSAAGITLGLNITAPEELSLHADHPALDRKELIGWLTELAQLALDKGYNLLLFTNGSPVDQVFLSVLAEELAKLTSAVFRVAERPKTPQELVNLITQCDIVAGHRMHSHITAYSFQIPTVGFAWDSKLNSFFSSVARDKYVLDLSTTSPRVAMMAIETATTAGIDEEVWKCVVDRADRDVELLAQALQRTARTARKSEYK